MEFVVPDDHEGLRQAIREVLPGAAWQRCYVHFLRNALDHLPRKLADDCLQELRWIYDRRDLVEVRRDIAAWLAQWQPKHPKLCDWVEENIEETLTYYRLPREHHKHMKSTNMLERLNQELKAGHPCRAHLPQCGERLRLVRALAVETHKNWLESPRYVNMQHLAEHKKEALRQAACSRPNLAQRWRRARRRQDQAASGGGPPGGRASLDRACARRPPKPRSGRRNGASIEQRNWLYAVPVQPPEPIGKRDSHDWRRVRACPDLVLAPYR